MFNIKDSIKKLLKERRLLLIDLSAIALVSTLAITWFHGNNLISGGDFGMPLDWVKYFKLMFSVWDPTVSLGFADYRQVASLLPYATFGALLQSLGFSLVFIEKVMFFFWFLAGGFSMYFLLSVIGMRREGKLLASFFYMFNPFSLIIIWHIPHGLIQMSYGVAPLILGMYIKGLAEKKNLKYIILMCSAWLVLTTSAYANPRSAVIHWLPIIFYFLTLFIFRKLERRTIVKFTGLLIVTWLLLNFYWIFPVISTMKESIASSHMEVLMSDIEEMKLTSVKFFDSIRMLGYWSLNSGYKGEPYYSYVNYYNSSGILLISWIIPFLSILGFFNKSLKNNPLKYFFILSLIIGFIGITGAYPPFGKILVWFYNTYPFFNLFTRFNYLFFGAPVYLIVSVLVGYGALTISDWLNKKSRGLNIALLTVFAVLLNVVLVFPFWNGEVIRSKGKLFVSERYQMPSYWGEAGEWLASQKEFFRILPLPMSKTYNIISNWGEGYSGGDPMRWQVPQPVINANIGENFKVPAIVGEAIETESDFSSISKILGFLNVKYLLLRNDTRWDFLSGHDSWYDNNPQKVSKFIKKQADLSLEKKIGQLDFYRVDEKYMLPQIYVPKETVLIKGEVEGLLDISQFLSPQNGQSFIFSDKINSGILEKINFVKNNYLFIRPVYNKIGEKEDYSKAIYKINSDEGKYELLLRNDTFSKYYQTGNTLKLQIDSNTIEERKIVVGGNNLLALGEVNLSKGDHAIVIFSPQANNLVSNFSFENSSETSALSSDALEGEYSLKVTANQGGNLVNIPINDLKAGNIYHITLATKHLSGDPAMVIFWQNLTDSPQPSFDYQLTKFGVSDLKTIFSSINLPAVSSWKKFDFTSKPNPFSKSIGISLVSIVNNPSLGKSENLFDTIEVNRVFNNPLTLKLVDAPAYELSSPEIEFKKLSSVKYEVSIKDAQRPYLLIFSESFHPGWVANIDADHLKVNGFANGWYIEKTGSYIINLYFKPQDKFYFAVFVSGISIFLSVVYLIIKALKNK